MKTDPVDMIFRYCDRFPSSVIPTPTNAADDAFQGDATLFARRDELSGLERRDWLISAMEKPAAPPPLLYEPGSWVPRRRINLSAGMASRGTIAAAG